MGLFIRSNFFTVIILIDEKPEIGTVSAKYRGGSRVTVGTNDSFRNSG